MQAFNPNTINFTDQAILHFTNALSGKPDEFAIRIGVREAGCSGYEEDESLCEAALRNGIKIEHACELSCACTTCHCIVRKGFESLDEASEIEEDMLDKAWGLESTSRLSCQVFTNSKDLTVELPKYTINQVSEEG